MKVAYLRVSSTSQRLEVQRDAVEKLNIQKIFEEKVSGTSTQGRVKLRECLDFVREGDELVITRIDRLARSVLDLQLIIKELTEKGVSLTATDFNHPNMAYELPRSPIAAATTQREIFKSNIVINASEPV